MTILRAGVFSVTLAEVIVCLSSRKDFSLKAFEAHARTLFLTPLFIFLFTLLYSFTRSILIPSVEMSHLGLQEAVWLTKPGVPRVKPGLLFNRHHRNRSSSVSSSFGVGWYAACNDCVCSRAWGRFFPHRAGRSCAAGQQRAQNTWKHRFLLVCWHRLCLSTALCSVNAPCLYFTSYF